MSTPPLAGVPDAPSRTLVLVSDDGDGRSDRSALPLPALLPLGGAPLLQRLLSGLSEAGLAAPLVVTGPARAESVARVVAARAEVVVAAPRRRSGRVDRMALLRAGLDHGEPPGATVLIHDADRGLTPASTLAAVLAAMGPGIDAVVPGIAVTDSVKSTQAAPARVLANIDRAGLTTLQSPRLLRTTLLEQVLGAATSDTPDSPAQDEIQRALSLGARVRLVPGSHRGGAVTDQLSLWQAQIALGLARDTRPR